jgi:hypothetical protein
MRRGRVEIVQHECVWPTSQQNGNVYGGADQQSLGYCETLISRISGLVRSKELECIFERNGTSLVAELDAFFADDTRDIAVISFNPDPARLNLAATRPFEQRPHGRSARRNRALDGPPRAKSDARERDAEDHQDPS